MLVILSPKLKKAVKVLQDKTWQKYLHRQQMKSIKRAWNPLRALKKMQMLK